MGLWAEGLINDEKTPERGNLSPWLRHHLLLEPIKDLSNDAKNLNGECAKNSREDSKSGLLE